MANPKKITLKSKGSEQTLGFDHALRLLRLEAQTGRIHWSIKTKGYEFKDNEIIRSTKQTKTAEE